MWIFFSETPSCQCLTVTSHERHGASDHQQHGCLFNGLLGIQENIKSSLALCEGIQLVVTGGFSHKKASNVESSSWRHDVLCYRSAHALPISGCIRQGSRGHQPSRPPVLWELPQRCQCQVLRHGIIGPRWGRKWGRITWGEIPSGPLSRTIFSSLFQFDGNFILLLPKF